MKAKKFFTASVPCLTDFIEENEDPLFKGDVFPSSSTILRYEQDGTTIIKDFFSGLWVDKSLADLLSKETFHSSEIEPKSLNLLLKKGVLVEKQEGAPIRTYYDKSVSPFYVSLEITSKCDADCVHCYNKEKETKEEPKTKDIIKRIDHLQKLGIQYIELSGGEPLLRKDLSEIVNEINKRKLFYCLLTNGSKLEEKISLLENVNLVCVSLDGPKKVHDEIRQFKGLHDKVISSLSELKKRGIKTAISMAVWDKNVTYMDYILKVCEKYAAIPLFTKVIPTGKALENFIKMSNNIKEIKCSLPKVYIDSLKRPKIEKNKPAIFYGCDMGRKGFAVNVQGSIMPCVYQRDFEIGNILNYSIESFNLKIESLRQKRIKSLSNCNICKLPENKTCGGPCYFSNTYKNWNGLILKKE